MLRKNSSPSTVDGRLVRWPMFVVGGFLAVMAVYTLVVLWKPEWSPC